MLFCTENGGNFVHALKHANHHLLIKLRALGEVGGSAEVVERKDVCPALRPAVDDFWGMDFREAVFKKEAPKPRANALLHLEDGALLLVSKGEGAVVEQRFKRRCYLLAVDDHGRLKRRRGKNLRLLKAHLKAGFAPGLRHDLAHNAHRHTLTKLDEGETRALGCIYALKQAPWPAQNHKREIRHFADFVNHAVYAHLLADAATERFKAHGATLSFV